MSSTPGTLSHDPDRDGWAPPETDGAKARGEASRVVARRAEAPRELSFYDRIEAFVSSLSVRDTFWHRICSLIWLPLAFFSGIRVKQIDVNSFTAVLPFKRFNRNWYHAMAGGALLANSEIAGGMYVFGVCGAEYTVVCKELEYKFLRPCLGPAVYKIHPREDMKSLIASKGEFNITLDLDVLQQVSKPGDRDRRVGKCMAVFHVTPKIHHKQKKLRGN